MSYYTDAVAEHDKAMDKLIHFKDNTLEDIKDILKNREQILKNNIHRNNCQMELMLLLNHLVSTKQPLSYRHVSYNPIEINVPQKFITAINDYTMAIDNPIIKDITLITGTGDTLHKKHMHRFIQENVIDNPLHKGYCNIMSIANQNIKELYENIVFSLK